MATLCRPAVSVPEYVITSEETLEPTCERHPDHPQLPLALRLIESTGVRTRHIVQLIEETLKHPGFEQRNKAYEAEAKARVPAVVQPALDEAELLSTDMGVINHVSCSGFMMPSMTAGLINNMGFNHDTKQIPIAQLGCAAGGAAINRAHDFRSAYPEGNALIAGLRVLLAVLPADRPGRRLAALQRPVRRRHRGRRRTRPGRRGHDPGAQRLVSDPQDREVDHVRRPGHRAPLPPGQASARHDGTARTDPPPTGGRPWLGRLRPGLLHHQRGRPPASSTT